MVWLGLATVSRIEELKSQRHLRFRCRLRVALEFLKIDRNHYSFFMSPKKFVNTTTTFQVLSGQSLTPLNPRKPLTILKTELWIKATLEKPLQAQPHHEKPKATTPASTTATMPLLQITKANAPASFLSVTHELRQAILHMKCEHCFFTYQSWEYFSSFKRICISSFTPGQD